MKTNFCDIKPNYSAHDIICQTMKTNKTLRQLADKTFILNLTIKQEQIQKEYQNILVSIQKNFKTKGFRTGKVPLAIVKQNISDSKIIEDIISRLVPRLYSQKIKKYHLKPIIQPQVKFKNPPITIDKDWQIEITACQLPSLSLKTSYQNQIKKINSSKLKNQDKINKIAEILIKNSQVTIPPVLIQTDLQKQLSSLIDQTRQAGLTVNQYLQSKKITLEQYKQNLAIHIQKQWTLNLAIDKIAQDHKIKSTNKATPSSPHARHIARQQKVMDFLQKL